MLAEWISRLSCWQNTHTVFNIRKINHSSGGWTSFYLIFASICEIKKQVIDHFGRPASNDEFKASNKGIKKHLDNLWVKLSAQYRTPNIDHQSIFEYWRNAIGASRLLWGSDWPHTGFEAPEPYELQMQRFLSLTNSLELRNQILSNNPQIGPW